MPNHSQVKYPDEKPHHATQPVTVRAKFRCAWITDHPGDTSVVRLEAVTGGEDNADWSKWTPNGSLEMMITNPRAIELFEPGLEYYLDIRRV